MSGAYKFYNMHLLTFYNDHDVTRQELREAWNGLFKESKTHAK